MATNNNHVVIMAGGVGSRFWPVSTEECPKQFLDIMGVGKTMLQLTLERFGDFVPMENVWVLTGARFAHLVREQLPQVPESNILIEPCGRGTAPCICYASWKIKKRNPRANVVITPSDHVVGDVETFRRAIEDTVAFAAETDSIVTLGMRPTCPNTGYGYICADLSYPALRQRNIFRVDSFKEKPDLATAREYIKRNNFFWNSGLYIWNVSTIVNAFRVYCREIGNVFESLLDIYDTPAEQDRINEVFPQCPNIALDYAITEKADEVFVYPVDFGWSDVGTWSSLHALLPKDEHRNAVVGSNVHVVESDNCIIHTTTCKTVVVQGLEDCVVVEKDGNLLICKMSEEQRIKSFH